MLNNNIYNDVHTNYKSDFIYCLIILQENKNVCSQTKCIAVSRLNIISEILLMGKMENY
jgi:hypothetical protein